MDTNFTFGATGGGPGSRPIRVADLDQLGDSADRAQLIAALGLISNTGPRHFLGERPARYGFHWWVEDTTTGKKLAQGRALTKRGMRSRRYRAYVAVLTAQKLAGDGSAAYAMDPACQHYVPFAKPCEPCGRAEA